MTLPHANDGHGRLVAAHHKEEYDTTARALLKERKFDPEDLNKACSIEDWYHPVTPLIYFCWKGNLEMVRYLIARGADCRKRDAKGCFPMFAAAAGGHLEIVRFLSHECGAHADIRKLTMDGYSPLTIALYNDHFDIVEWLIRNGALSSSPHDAVDGGVIDDAIMRRDLRQETGDHWQEDKRLTVLAWAQISVAAYENVNVFLTGTLVSASSSSVCATRSHKRRKVVSPSSSSPLVIFNGKSGILEVIAHFSAGTPQQLRTLRQLVNLLPALIADVPFVIEEEDDDE